MGGSPVTLGPFSGGLNLSRSARVIEENELAECKNFDINIRGELFNRPGVRSHAGPGWDANAEVLAVAKRSTTINEIYAQGSVGGTYSVFYTGSVHSLSWTNLINYAAGDKAGDAIQYFNKMWIPGLGPTAVGYSVDIATHAVATVAGMPKGTNSFIYKDRMFIFDTAAYRVYYSAATDLTNWPAANFFDINPGDGEPILAALVSGESIMFFKQNSTWILYYDSDPGLGVLRKLNTDIGVTGKNAATVINNDVYVVGYRGVYRVTNGFFEDVSMNLDIFKHRSATTADSIKDYVRALSDRMIVRIASNAGGYRYFVMFLETGIWTEYTFPTAIGAFHRFQDSDNLDHYVGFAENANLYIFTPYGDNPGVDAPVATFSTKRFDYGDPAGWKRLFWFSGEIASTHAFTMSVTPDSKTAATVTTNHAAPPEFISTIVKSFLSQRFRTIQYKVTAGGTSGSKFVFLNGSVSVEPKKRVTQRETV